MSGDMKNVFLEWPVKVRCMIQGARGWCTGMTQRDVMGREVGGGFRMGNICTPTVDSCQCMAKPIQYCKAIKINKFILKKEILHPPKKKEKKNVFLWKILDVKSKNKTKEHLDYWFK